MSQAFRSVPVNADILPNLLKVLDLILERTNKHMKLSQDTYYFNDSVFRKKNHTFGRKSVSLINECLRNQRFEEAAKLLWILCQDRSCFDLVLYKGIMVVLENLQINDKNEIMEKFCKDIQSGSFLNKLDVKLEYQMYSMRNDIPDLLETLEVTKPERKSVRIERNVQLKTIHSAYCALLNYIKWCKSCKGDEGAANKAITGFKDLLKQQGTWDIFILKLVEMLEYYNNYSEIEDILMKYVKQNPDHINAHVYLCVHLHKYNSDPDIFIQHSKVLAELCPHDVRVLLLVHTWNDLGIQLKERLKILFMFLDYPVNGKNVVGWRMLASHLTQAYDSGESTAIKFIKSSWDLRYHSWNYMHFDVSNICCEHESNSALLTYKASFLSHLAPDHEYIKEAQRKVPDLCELDLKNVETLSKFGDFQLLYKLDDDMHTRE